MDRSTVAWHTPQVDDELLGIARTAIGEHFGLSPEQAARLHGSTASELRDDANAMRAELELPPLDERRERDARGRFRSGEGDRMNTLIRRAAGR